MASTSRLVGPDGERRCRVGLVDMRGTTLWLLDVDNNEFYEYHPLDEALMAEEAARRRAERDAEDARAEAERVRELAERAVRQGLAACELAGDMLSCGKFPQGTKGSFGNRRASWKSALKATRKELRC